jgi:hypothetical protein
MVTASSVTDCVFSCVVLQGGFSAVRKTAANLALVDQSALHTRKRLKQVCATDPGGLAVFMERKSINDRASRAACGDR